MVVGVGLIGMTAAGVEDLVRARVAAFAVEGVEQQHTVVEHADRAQRQA